MRIKSPLSDLCEVLSQVRDAAVSYHVTLTRNEAATRAVLVDPVLRALGWDTADTNMVEVEKTFGASRVDYALYDHSNEVRIIVEAKQLGKNLSDAGIILSLVQYAFTYGLQDIFLTDGLIWHHFTNFQPGSTGATKVMLLMEDDLVECAAYLVQRLDAAKFWPQEQTISTVAQQVAELESAVANLQQEVEKLKVYQPPAVVVPKPAPVAAMVPAPASPSSVTNGQFIPLEQIGSVAGKKPRALRLPDGTITETRTWTDVLRECCKYTLAHNSSIPIPFPDRAGKKVSLFSFVKPAPGLAHSVLSYNGNQVYVYVNYDSSNSILNSIHVLKQVPASAPSVTAAVQLS